MVSVELQIILIAADVESVLYMGDHVQPILLQRFSDFKIFEFNFDNQRKLLTRNITHYTSFGWENLVAAKKQERTKNSG